MYHINHFSINLTIFQPFHLRRVSYASTPISNRRACSLWSLAHLVSQAGALSTNSFQLSRLRHFLTRDSISEPTFQLVPHVNLLKGSVEELTALLNCEVAEIGNVTHAFYFGACLIIEGHSWVPMNELDKEMAKCMRSLFTIGHVASKVNKR